MIFINTTEKKHRQSLPQGSPQCASSSQFDTNSCLTQSVIGLSESSQ